MVFAITKMANEARPFPTVQRPFAEYVEEWQVRQRSYLDKLLVHLNDTNSDEESSRHLVEQVLSHYQEYFEEKKNAADSDVFLLFSPPWLSSFEWALFWMAGFKPSLTLRLVKESVGEELTAEQKQRIERVREETRRKETEIAEAMATVQESVAAPPFYELVKREARLVDGEVSELDDAAETLKAAMREVVKDADFLRQKSASDVMEILSPIQRVKLLIAKAQFWLQARKLGLANDNQRNRERSTFPEVLLR